MNRTLSSAYLISRSEGTHKTTKIPIHVVSTVRTEADSGRERERKAGSVESCEAQLGAAQRRSSFVTLSRCVASAKSHSTARDEE